MTQQCPWCKRDVEIKTAPVVTCPWCYKSFYHYPSEEKDDKLRCVGCDAKVDHYTNPIKKLCIVCAFPKP